MRHRLLFVLALLALGGGLYVLFSSGAGTKSAGKGEKPNPPVPVSVAQVRLQDMPRRLDAVGRGEAFETVTLRARIDGQVASVLFEEGQPVHSGELLIRLDSRDESARVAQAEANLARDQALLARARNDVVRYAALREQGFVSEERVNEVRANAGALEATVRADQAALELARLQLGYTEIRAPFAGIAGVKEVYPGAAVKANDTDLVVVNRIRPLNVVFTVPEKHLPDLRAAAARQELLAEVRIPGNAAPAVAAKVVFIDRSVDTATGTARLKATLANDDERFIPGQFLAVTMTLDTWRQAATVPAQAVQQGPDGAFVLVVRADKAVAVRPVTLAATSDGVAIISQGLSAGETVVTDGHVRLTPKSRVTVKPPVAAGR